MAGAKLLRCSEGPPGRLWLTNKPDRHLAQGLLWALQVQQALVQVLLQSAVASLQLEQAHRDGVDTDPPPAPRTGLPCQDTRNAQPAAGMVPGFGGSRGQRAPWPRCCSATLPPKASEAPLDPGGWGKWDPSALQAGRQDTAAMEGRGKAPSPICWGLGERGFSRLACTALGTSLPCTCQPSISALSAAASGAAATSGT